MSLYDHAKTSGNSLRSGILSFLWLFDKDVPILTSLPTSSEPMLTVRDSSKLGFGPFS